MNEQGLDGLGGGRGAMQGHMREAMALLQHQQLQEERRQLEEDEVRRQMFGGVAAFPAGWATASRWTTGRTPMGSGIATRAGRSPSHRRSGCAGGSVAAASGAALPRSTCWSYTNAVFFDIVLLLN
jgi:hypothetical protein